MNTRSLHFANSAITIQWQGERAGQLIDFVFAAVPDTGPALPHMTLNLRQSDGDLFHLAGPESVDTFRGNYGQMCVRIAERACYHLADRSRDGLLLHAACLSHEGRALLMPGVSGAGKSTLVVWLALQGYHYQTDELVFLHDDSHQCQALARPVYLKKSAGQVKDDKWHELLEHSALPAGSGWLVSPAALGYSAGETSVAKTIVFPRYQAGAGFEFEQLSRADAVVALTGLLLNARNLPENGFPSLLNLAREITAFRMVYSHFKQIGNILEKTTVL